MPGKQVIIVAVLYFLVLCDCYWPTNKSECRTPRGTAGVCYPIKECPIIVNVFETNQLTDETKERIQEYKCEEFTNGIPKVCCEEDAFPCKTPENTAGICVPLLQCQPLTNLLNQKPFLSPDIVQYLQHSECSKDSKPRVCCPFIEKSPNIHKRNKPHLETDSVLPKPLQCGIQAVELKIIGGVKVDIAEFPWMALLEYGPKVKPILACGGTLISARYVLTAGHCLHGPIPGRYGGVQRIRLGEYNIRNETDCIWSFDGKDCADPILQVDVETVAVHEKFQLNALVREHDIAVIKMKEDVTFSDFVRPICLPTPDKPFPKYFSVAGWGSTELSDQSVDKLKVSVPFFDKRNCSNLYERLLKGAKLGKGQICAGGVVGKDSCTGDSGGPLMAGIAEQYEQIWYQFGVISFGPTPCGKPHPAVYTAVSDYVPWIVEQINKLS